MAKLITPSNTPALSDGNQCLNYSELVVSVEDLAGAFVKCDCSVIAFSFQNSLDWVLIDLACQKAGLVCVPLPAFFSAGQIRHCLREAGVDLYISEAAATFPDDYGMHAEKVSVKFPLLGGSCAWKLAVASCHAMPERTQKITFTSGTTGNPKGVCLSLRHQWQVAESLTDVIAIKSPRHLCLLPLATLLENIGGVYVPLLCGGLVQLPNSEKRGFLGSSCLHVPALLDCIQDFQPNTLILIPELLVALVEACQLGWQPPESLYFVAIGGGKVSPDLILQARQLGIPVYEGYGLSECASVVALNVPGRDKLGTVGTALGHCNVSLQDGEICVAGSAYLGYLSEPESWYPKNVSTGDEGSVDGQGFLSVNGRKKNVLISTYGRNINPEWVESVLMSVPILSRCVVVGDSKPFLMAIVGAPETVSDEEIDCWVAQANKALPDYARIKSWLRIDLNDWQPFTAANGRSRRNEMISALADLIEARYLQAAIRT